MAKSLYFRFGAMNSGKSTALLQAAYNYTERGLRAVVAKPTVDTKSPQVQSRLGVEYTVDWAIHPQTSFLTLLAASREAEEQEIKCIVVDEAQFLAPWQVDELFEIAVLENIPVLAYGLRADFRTKAFPGSLRLLEIAHHLEELRTICQCGSKAIFNGRMIGDNFVKEGDAVAIDGQDATYRSLCGRCYFTKVGKFS